MADPGSGRRSQADRRAAARLALLDATIDSLVEYGYKNVTGAQIAKRAGVARALQAYYFSTKAELVVAALEHLTGKMVDQFRADLPVGPDLVATAMGLLDRCWELHDSDGFTAGVELWMASRTDAELREHVRVFTRELTTAIVGVVGEAVPGLSGNEEFLAVLTTAMATVRGVILMGFTMSEQSQHHLWLTVRSQLEKLVIQAVERSS